VTVFCPLQKLKITVRDRTDAVCYLVAVFMFVADCTYYEVINVPLKEVSKCYSYNPDIKANVGKQSGIQFKGGENNISNQINIFSIE